MEGWLKQLMIDQNDLLGASEKKKIMYFIVKFSAFSTYFVTHLTFNVRMLKNRLSQSLHGNIGASTCRFIICRRIAVRSVAR